jgi:hypothetical protein
MSPTTKSPFDGSDSPLRPVSLNPSHYRSGRWFLLAEGGLLLVLGGGGVTSALAHPDADPAGAPVLWLALTPTHSGLLLGFGVLAVCAVARRRHTVIITGFGAVLFLLLFTIGTGAAARHAPWVLGFDLRDSVLHAVLLVFNLALLMWLIPDALEGPAWVRRRRGPSRRRRRQDCAQGDPQGSRQSERDGGRG